MWESGTKDEIRMFEALFEGVKTRFGRRTIEQSVEIRMSSFVHPSKIFVWGAWTLQDDTTDSRSM